MFPGIFHVKENVNRSDVILQKISYHLENIYNVTKKQRFTVLDQKGRNSLSKDLLKEVVDFTSSQCLNLVYKPVLVRGYNRNMGEYPIDTIITDDDLVLGYDQIPIDEVVNVEFGYYNDEHRDRIEKVVVDSIQEVKDFIESRCNKIDSFPFTPVSCNFPFYECDRIGCGYVLIETNEDSYEIFYPTRKTSFQEQWERDSNKKDKKIYFVSEGIVDGDPIQSEKFNQIINPETNEQIFSDVFHITECSDFEKCKDKDEFLATVLEMSISYFEDFGDDIGEITVIAIDEDTDIFQWGVSMKVLDDGTFQYGTIDYKSDGKILKFAE